RTDPVQGEHGLQLGAVAIPQGGEAELAGVAYEDHPAGDRHLVAGGGVGGQVRVLRADLGERRGAGEADRVRLHALGEHPVPLLPADLHLLGKVVGGVHWHGVLLGHGTLPRHEDYGGSGPSVLKRSGGRYRITCPPWRITLRRSRSAWPRPTTTGFGPAIRWRPCGGR